MRRCALYLRDSARGDQRPSERFGPLRIPTDPTLLPLQPQRLLVSQVCASLRTDGPDRRAALFIPPLPGAPASFGRQRIRPMYAATPCRPIPATVPPSAAVAALPLRTYGWQRLQARTWQPLRCARRPVATERPCSVCSALPTVPIMSLRSRPNAHHRCAIMTSM